MGFFAIDWDIKPLKSIPTGVMMTISTIYGNIWSVTVWLWSILKETTTLSQVHFHGQDIWIVSQDWGQQTLSSISKHILPTKEEYRNTPTKYKKEKMFPDFAEGKKKKKKASSSLGFIHLHDIHIYTFGRYL